MTCKVFLHVKYILSLLISTCKHVLFQYKNVRANIISPYTHITLFLNPYHPVHHTIQHGSREENQGWKEYLKKTNVSCILYIRSCIPSCAYISKNHFMKVLGIFIVILWQNRRGNVWSHTHIGIAGAWSHCCASIFKQSNPLKQPT